MGASPVDSPETKRVLVVDHDASVRAGYAQVLGQSGWTVVAAGSGPEAIETLTRQPADAIICELAMPGMDGIDFLRAVRERDQEVPVVIVAGAPALDSATRAIEYGVFRYLKKPVAADLLASTLERASQMHPLAQLKREGLE